MSSKPPHRPPAAPPAVMQSAVWEGDLPARWATAFPQLTLGFKTYLGQNFTEVPANAVVDTLQYLKTHEGFDMLVDLTAVDRPQAAERFEIIYTLYSFRHNERIRLKLFVPLDAAVPSATSVFEGANWLEREVFDMFGIPFSGHPGLKRILMPEEWTGFPLRKDNPITGMDQQWVQQNLNIESGQ